MCRNSTQYCMLCKLYLIFILNIVAEIITNHSFVNILCRNRIIVTKTSCIKEIKKLIMYSGYMSSAGLMTRQTNMPRDVDRNRQFGELVSKVII